MMQSSCTSGLQQQTFKPSPIVPQVVRHGQQQYVLQPVVQNALSSPQLLSYALSDGVSPHHLLVPFSVVQQNCSSTTSTPHHFSNTNLLEDSSRIFTNNHELQQQQQIETDSSEPRAFSRPTKSSSSKFRRFSPPPLSAPPRVVSQEQVSNAAAHGKTVTFDDTVGKETEEGAVVGAGAGGESPKPFLLAPTPAQLGLAPGQTKRNSRHSSSGLPIGDQKNEIDEQQPMTNDNCDVAPVEIRIEESQNEDVFMPTKEIVETNDPQHEQQQQQQMTTMQLQTDETSACAKKKLFKRQDESMDK